MNSQINNISDTLKDLYEPIAPELVLVEQGLENQIKLIAENHEKLVERHLYLKDVIRQLSLMRGKLLRPALVLLCGKIVGSELTTELVSMAIASELVHAASLIHDDIIDNAITRRARKALYREFGISIAVLVGDVLYAQFFTLITELNLSSEARLRLMQLFCAVTKRMSQGEIFQHGIKRYKIEPTVEDYLVIIKSKTASLMEACCAAGALVGGGTNRQVKEASDFGCQFGLVFQLIDDQMDKDQQVATGANGDKNAAIKAAYKSLETFPESEAKISLINLITVVISQTTSSR